MKAIFPPKIYISNTLQSAASPSFNVVKIVKFINLNQALYYLYYFIDGVYIHIILISSYCCFNMFCIFIIIYVIVILVRH